MATRDYLYSRFENYDKPDEKDFQDLIDMAAKQVTFRDIDLPVVSDIVSDINTITIQLDIRDVKVIKYGSEVYLFTNIEGTYGLGGIPITSDMLVLIANIGSNYLLNDLVANISVGGISAGDTFPAGTTFEDIFRALLTTTGVSNFTYTANTQDVHIKTGDSLHITQFSWVPLGNPQNMTITDHAGKTINVSGSSVNVDWLYTFVNPTTMTWTLNYTGGHSNIITKWLHPSYYGKKTNKALPTESEILAGTELLVESQLGIGVPINTSVSEIGWVAVPLSQTGEYTQWYISDLNKSIIGPNEFIFDAGDVIVNGVVYSVYMYNYTSKVERIILG